MGCDVGDADPDVGDADPDVGGRERTSPDHAAEDEGRHDGTTDGRDHGTDRARAIHDPAASRDDERSTGSEWSQRDDESRPPDAPGCDREFGWRGWVLVGWLVVALVVVPTALFFLPRAGGLVASLGLSLRTAYLVLPLLPALVLGALAVWATTRT